MKKILVGVSVLSLVGVGVLVGWLLARTTVSPAVEVPVATIPPSAALAIATPPVETVPSSIAGDFVPPAGRAAGAKEYTAGVRRILTATSTDGVRFTPTGTIFSDRANVPDVLVDDDGTIRVYYIGQGIQANKEENTAVAFSQDGGKSWTYRLPTYVNFPNHRDPSDPDVVRLSDGTYRMYFTYSVSATKLGIAYADSPDGMTFTYKGGSFEDVADAVDSNTVLFNGVWHMFLGRERLPGQRHATSTDGRTFALASDEAPKLPGRDYYSSDEVVEDGVIRLFAFSKTEGNARSFTSADGTTWAAGDVALTADDATTLGTGFLQDVAVAKLADGTWFMAYVSGMPTE